MSRNRYVFSFEEGQIDDRFLLGGKGAGLAEMARLGIPIPPGFIISTEACKDYRRSGEMPDGLWNQVEEYLRRVDKLMARRFGDQKNPLLVSVRSGAAVSMPGMMDTVLNLGLTSENVEGLAEQFHSRRFAYDSYRRFLEMYGNVVLKMDRGRFERHLADTMASANVGRDGDLPEYHLVQLIERYREVFADAGTTSPDDPMRQLKDTIRAVFDSWSNPRAVMYRKIHGISEELGTAVVVQAMVFGNLDTRSATGVLFTRNPNTGEKVLYGEYLVNAQGEDVVSGVRTPQPMTEFVRDFPDVDDLLKGIAQRLEGRLRDMQDIEFTVEAGNLYLLQTRSGKRTAQAAVKIAVDLVHEGILDKRSAVLRVDPDQIVQLLHPQLDSSASIQEIARGLPASPGAATGKVVFSADQAVVLSEQGEAVILVRSETNPDDIHGIAAAQGVLTTRGGTTSHAAVVARGMGKPAVTGCDGIVIDPAEERFQVGFESVGQFETITIDGATGRVILGTVPTIKPDLSQEFQELLGWCDELRRLGVEANADTPEDAERARQFGAEGIGLCRTEHMFMGPERLPRMRAMIVAETGEERKEALRYLEAVQTEDFFRILKVMDGLPVTIRLLDPPMHEFLPKIPRLTEDLVQAQALGSGNVPMIERLLRRARQLAEFNPMLGFRGVRLAIVYPEIYEMQARAIFGAMTRLIREQGKPKVEIMIPLTVTKAEMERMRELIAKVRDDMARDQGISLPYKLGTMIEVPRAALIADQLAEVAEFFSVGTNDMTQMVYGLSRDDSEGKFLASYMSEGILDESPFVRIDEQGVGQIIEMAIEAGRKTRPNLSVGICGEHAGDPASITYCHRIGIDYVSCSPYRVPLARLAAAHAAILSRTES